jgi:hypothetical protein
MIGPNTCTARLSFASVMGGTGSAETSEGRYNPYLSESMWAVVDMLPLPRPEEGNPDCGERPGRRKFV